METRLKASDPKVKSKFLVGPLSNFYMIDCSIFKSHRSGGLAIIWSDVINVDILHSNKNLIDMYITPCNSNLSWQGTGIYRYPYTPKKHLTCDIIKNLSLNKISPNWLIFGDFNLMLNSSEKLGGNPVDFQLSKLFNDTLIACDLYDFGFYGNKFTWANNQPNKVHIKERIDRFCATINWINSFPRFLNKHLLRYTSDHNPIVLDFHEANISSFTQRKTKIMRFEHIWTTDQESSQIIKRAWESNTSRLTDKLSSALYQITTWGNNKFGNIPKQIKHHQEILEKLKNEIPDENCILRIKALEKDLGELLKQEETWWAQRAKVHWLKQGDLNTKIFHQRANQRKRKNHIHKIQDPMGNTGRIVTTFTLLLLIILKTSLLVLWIIGILILSLWWKIELALMIMRSLIEISLSMKC